MRARDQGVDLVDADHLVRGGDRHDLLSQHVERVAGDDGGLDLALAHPAGDHRALEQIGAELGKDATLGDVADVVAGTADALHSARDGLRRLDLEHEVDRAHVDAELQRRRGDEARKAAGLQLLLHDEALLARQRAVVRPRDLRRRRWSLRVVVLVLRGRELIEAQGQPLRRAAIVDEHDRRAVLTHQPEQLGVDRRPDRLAGGLAAEAGVELEVGVRLDHGLDRHVDLEVQRLAHAGVDHPAGSLRADEETRDLLERALGRAQADALERALRKGLEALEREGQVRAALGLSDRVDLVHDRPLHAVEQLPRPRGEHQVEGLGRGDEDVRRLAEHRLPVALGRVARADRDRHVAADAPQRRPKVAFDVVGERLQRRDVHQSRAPFAGGKRVGRQAVQSPEERRQRLARTCRRRQQHVLAGRDRRPRLFLRRRWGFEGAFKPCAGALGELGQRHRTSLARAYGELPSSRARPNTASSIASVSRPVNVFCWDG